MVVVTSLEVVVDVTFMRLNMLTRSTKIAKEGDEEWLNNTSSKLNPRN
jgi:hypothetical protein